MIPTVTFLSNYINHHQIPFSNEMFQRIGDRYRFVQMEPMEEERIQMGWGTQLEKQYPYVLSWQENPEICEKLVEESDVVIFGGEDHQELIRNRLNQSLLDGKKITFRYSERLYKDGQWKWISPRGLIKKYRDHIRYQKAPVYLLCAGGYVASDYQLIRAYRGKKLKWGYFPELKEYGDFDTFYSLMKRNTEGATLSRHGADEYVTILWAGRFLEWKHPEVAIYVAEKLRDRGCRFHLTMIGGGEKLPEIEQQVAEKKLQQDVNFAGFLSPEQVRKRMEQADIFLLTSDYHEGWGAVLNEAMNSGCAVVVNRGVGAVPYLIQDGKNGLIYENGNREQCVKKILYLLESGKTRYELGKAAYDTIQREWNAAAAAQNLLQVINNLMRGRNGNSLKEIAEVGEAPACIAEIISPGYFH